MIREKKIRCGKNYMDVDIYPYTKSQAESRRKKRGKKKKVSAPKQKNLNDKKSKKYLGQLFNTNFTINDYAMFFTFKSKFHPKTPEEAEVIFKNYLKRVNYRRKQKGLGLAKYIWIIEYDVNKNGTACHIHFHLIIDGDLSRDELEDLWRFRKTKGQKQGTKIGVCSSRRLEPDSTGLIGLAMYLTKREKSKRKWSPSQNLKKPIEMPPNDHKYTRRQLINIAKGFVDDEYFRKKYPGWRIADKLYGIQTSYNDQTGYYVYLKLNRDTS